jgi:tetratricopeptide (TPR) repeat protein
LNSPELQARLEMEKAGLVFIIKNGSAQFPAALDRYRTVIAANPGLQLTRQETDRYGELLLAAKDYPSAQKVYQQFLNSAGNDPADLALAYYGLAAVALDQNDLATARTYLTKLKALPGGAVWFKHINDVTYDLAYIQEQSGTPADLDAAKFAYAQLMKSIGAGAVVQTKSLLGYGRILEKEGYTLASHPDPKAGSIEYAIHYYQQPNLMFFTATPEQSAEGLYLAGQAFDKAGDKANAKKQYDIIISAYKTTAPDWVAKAQAAETQ